MIHRLIPKDYSRIYFKFAKVNNNNNQRQLTLDSFAGVCVFCSRVIYQ